MYITYYFFQSNKSLKSIIDYKKTVNSEKIDEKLFCIFEFRHAAHGKISRCPAGPVVATIMIIFINNSIIQSDDLWRFNNLCDVL